MELKPGTIVRIRNEDEDQFWEVVEYLKFLDIYCIRSTKDVTIFRNEKEGDLDTYIDQMDPKSCFHKWKEYEVGFGPVVKKVRNCMKCGINEEDNPKKWSY
jgi:hypothetical protein